MSALYVISIWFLPGNRYYFIIYRFNSELLINKTMDKKSVKINAEKIWHTLNEVKSVSISELARILNLSIESTALAVGWLVCENKVSIGSKNGQIESVVKTPIISVSVKLKDMLQ